MGMGNSGAVMSYLQSEGACLFTLLRFVPQLSESRVIFYKFSTTMPSVEDLDDTRAPIILYSNATLLSIGTVMVILRFYARKRGQMKLGPDDWLTLFAGVSE